MLGAHRSRPRDEQVTPGSQGWPFLVARGRREGFRTLLAPGFLIERGMHDVLARAAGYVAGDTTSTRIADAAVEGIGELRLVFASERLTYDAVGRPGPAAATFTEERGRPIEIIFGVVTRDLAVDALCDDDLVAARTAAVSSYREFLGDEVGYRIRPSEPIDLAAASRGRGSLFGARRDEASDAATTVPPTRDATSGPEGRDTTPARASRARTAWRVPAEYRWPAIGIGAALALVGVAAAIEWWPRSSGPPHPLVADVLSRPRSVPATDGRRHLVYELALTNTTSARVRVDGIDVRAGDGRRRLLARYGRPGVARLTVGAPASLTIPAGRRRTLFLDVRLRPKPPVPAAISHDFEVRVRGDDAVLKGARSAVDRAAPVSLGLPLAGGRQLVSASLGRGANRLAVREIGGRRWVARRFGIDILRLGPSGGATFAGDPGRNASYFAFGQPVVAAATGTVVAIRDGVRDRAPSSSRRSAPSATAEGNFVMQRIAGGRIVVYAGLQAGSVRVAPGRRVKRGELLARVGNSGEPGVPRLRLRVMDSPGGPTTLAADGVPFVFARFALEGRLVRGSVVAAARPRARADELPLSADIIAPR